MLDAAEVAPERRATGLYLFLVGFFLAFLLAYPQVFYVQKYNVPWTGMNDFADYHEIVRHPLDFDVVPAVFAMRQFTPLLARAIHDLGATSPNSIWFEKNVEYQGRQHDKDIFFSLILANFLGLCTACGLVYAALARDDPRTAGVVSLPAAVGVALLLLAGNTIFYVLSPLTGGWTWAFAAAIFLLARRSDGWRHAAIALLLLSVFQRELVCVGVGTWAAVHLLFGSRAGRRRAVELLAGAVAAAALYLLLRVELLPVVEINEEQLSPTRWIALLPRLPHIMATQPWFVMGVLKLNLFGAWLLAVFAVLVFRRPAREETVALAAILASAAVLFLLSLVTLNSAPDRVIMTIAPVYVLSLMDLLHRHILDSGRPASEFSGNADS